MFENGFFNIGDIIVLAMVAAGFFIYRRLDRNNKSLEIVKKYSDNAKKELDKILEEKRADLNDITVDLEVEEKKNRQILERFQDARDELLQNASVLEGFQEQISYYNKYMDELRSVAGRIDENLLRLKNESEYVDEVGQRLTVIRKEEIVLGKQLAGINNDFEKMNQQHLESIESNLVEHFKGETGKFREELRITSEQVEGFKNFVGELNASRDDYAQRQMAELQVSLDSSMENFHGAIASAAERGSKLEGDIFDAIQVSVEKRATKAEKNWISGMSSLKSEVIKNVTETRERLEGFDGDVNQWKDHQLKVLEEAIQQSEYNVNQWKDQQQRTLENIKNENESAAAETRERLEGFDGEVDQWKNSQLTLLEEAKQQSEYNVNQWKEQQKDILGNIKNENELELREWEDDKIIRMEGIAERLGHFENELTSGSIKTRIDELAVLNDEFVANVEHQKITLQGKLDEKFGEIEKGINADFETWERDKLEESKKLKEESKLNVIDMRTTLEEGKLETKNKVNTFKKEIKESVNKLQRELHGVNLIRAEFGKEIDGMKGEVENNAKEMNSIIDKYVHSESERVSRKADTLEIRIMTDIEGRRKSYEQIVNDKLDKFQGIFKEIDAMEGTLKGNLEASITRMKADSDGYAESILGEIEKDLKGYKRAISKKYGRLEKLVDEMGTVETGLRTSLEDMSTGVKRDLISFNTGMVEYQQTERTRAEEELAGVHGSIDGLKQELDEVKTSATGNLNSVIETFELEFNTLLEEKNSGLHNELNRTAGALKTELDQNTGAFKEELDSKTGALKEELSRTTGSFKEELNSKTGALKEELDSTTGALKDELNNATGAIQEELNSTTGELKEELDSKTGALKNELATTTSAIKEEIDTLSGDLEKRTEDLTNINGDLRSKTTKLQENLDSELGIVSGKIDDFIEQSTDNLKVKFVRVENDIADFYKTEKGKAEENIEGMRDLVTSLQLELSNMRHKTAEEMQSNLSDFEEQFNAELEGKNDLVNKRFDEWEHLFNEKVDLISSEEESRREKMESEFFNTLKTRLATIKSDVTSEMNAFQDNVMTKRQTTLESLQKSEDEYKEMFNTITSQMSGLRNESENVISIIGSQVNEANSMGADLGERLEYFKSTLSTQVSEVEDRMARMKDDLLRNSEEKLVDFEKSVVDNLSVRNDNLTTRMDDWSNSIEKKLDDLTNKKTGEMEKLEIQFRDDFSGQVSNIENRVTEQFNVVQELAKQYREKVLSQVQEATGEFESYRVNVLSEMNGLKVNSKEAVSSIRNELADAAQVKGEIDTLIVDYKSSFDGEVTRMESDLKAEITRIGSEMNNATESIETTLLSNVEERQKSYENVLKTRFSKIDRFMLDLDALEASLRKSMDQEVKDVQIEFDNFSKSMLAVRGEERKKLEVESENLRRTILEMEMQINEMKSDVYDNMGEKLQLFEDDFFTDLKKRGENLENSIKKWREDVDVQIQDIGHKFVNNREEIEARYNEELNERLAGLEQQLQSNMNRVTSEVEDFQEGITTHIRGEAESAKTEMMSLINASRDDVSSWQNNVLDKLQIDKQGIDDDVSKFKNAVDHNIQYLQDNFSEQRDSLIEQTQNERDNLKSEIVLTEERLSTIESDLSAIHNKQQEFKEHTQMFARTDQLKIQLENDIKRLESNVESVSDERAEVSVIRNEFIEVTELYKDASGLISKFLSEKQKVDIMENKIDRMVDLSESVDRQYTRIGESSEQLQNYQMRLKQLEDFHTDLQDRYTNIEKKSPLLDSTASSIDSSFEKITNIHGELKTIMDQVSPLFEKIQTMEERNNNLFLENDRIELIMSRIEDLGAMLSDVDRRIEQSEKAREWLAGIEKRMEDLNKDIQDKVKILGDLTSGKMDKNDEAPGLEKREMVINLKKQKWENVQIARAVGLGVGEVELILEMEHGKTKGRKN